MDSVGEVLGITPIEARREAVPVVVRLPRAASDGDRKAAEAALVAAAKNRDQAALVPPLVSIAARLPCEVEFGARHRIGRFEVAYAVTVGRKALVVDVADEHICELSRELALLGVTLLPFTPAEVRDHLDLVAGEFSRHLALMAHEADPTGMMTPPPAAAA